MKTNIVLLCFLFFQLLMRLCTGEEIKYRHLLPEDKVKWDTNINNMLEDSLENDNNDNPRDLIEIQTVQDSSEIEGIEIDKQLTKMKEEYQFLSKKVQRFTIRYINLFLHITKLKDEYIDEENLNSVKNINLEFSISMRDLLFLQTFSRNLSKGDCSSCTAEQLGELENIFSKGLQLKYNYDKWSFSVQNIDFRTTLNWILSKSFLYRVILFILVLWVFVKIMFNSFSIRLVLVSFNVAVFLEGLYNYFDKLKEADLVEYTNALKSKHFEDECDPTKMTYWKMVQNWFSDTCLEYHKSIAFNEADKISPIECILNTYRNYFLEFPAGVFGSLLRIVSENSLGFLPPVMREVVMIFFNVFLLIFVLGIIYCSMKPRIRLIMPGLKLDVDHESKNERISGTSQQGDPAIENELRKTFLESMREKLSLKGNNADSVKYVCKGKDEDREIPEDREEQRENPEVETIENVKESECAEDERTTSIEKKSLDALATEVSKKDSSSVLDDLTELKQLLSKLKSLPE